MSNNIVDQIGHLTYQFLPLPFAYSGSHGADGNMVRYTVNRPYRNVFAFEAKRLALQKTLDAVYKALVSGYVGAQIEKKMAARDKVINDTNKKIIENGQIVMEGYGEYHSESSGKTVVARDLLGRKVETALIISYVGEDPIEYTEEKTYPVKSGEPKYDTFKIKDVISIDLQPQIEVSSKNNVNLTQVQGRDYSRKEIVSNGDVSFNVSGKFVSPYPDVYPTNEVRRFINIARHNGIIDVNNIIFGNHNVNKIVILDYSLPQTECLNEQPYSFTCVGVEPDDETLKQDTLNTVLYEAAVSNVEGWYKSVLTQQLLKYTENTISTSAAISIDASIEKLINSI